jgi:hypothetical protein
MHFSTTGPCTVDGSCVSSPNFGQGSYDNNEACTIHASSSGTMHATSFETERNFDHLTVGGTRYSGSDGPVGISVDPSTEVPCAVGCTDRMVSMWCDLCRSLGQVTAARLLQVGGCALQRPILVKVHSWHALLSSPLLFSP